MPKKKKFVDKKNAQHFHVVYRSQHDPLIADSEASEHVLVPANSLGEHPEPTKTSTLDPKKRKEILEYGFPDDGYDYTKHLRSVDDTSSAFLPVKQPNMKEKEEDVQIIDERRQKKSVRFVQLPPEALPSKVMDAVGMLNRGSSQGLDLSLDPEIVKAMDEASGIEGGVVMAEFPEQDASIGEAKTLDSYMDDDDLVGVHKFNGPTMIGDLEDDFFQELANDEPSNDVEDMDSGEAPHHSYGLSSSANYDRDMDGDSDFSSDDDNDGGLSRGGKSVTQTILDMHSVTSSIFTQGGKTNRVDDHFEQILKAYGDKHLGELDEDDPGMEGYVDTNDLEGMLDQFLEENAPINVSELQDGSKQTKPRDEKDSEFEEEAEEKEYVAVAMPDTEQEEHWDCETVLTTLTTTDNLPGVISGPQKKKKAKTEPVRISRGIAVDGLEGRHKSGKEVMEESEPGVNLGIGRKKSETDEEKKKRKQEIKAMRKMRRHEKKQSKVQFRAEEQKQRYTSAQRSIDVGEGTSVVKY